MARWKSSPTTNDSNYNAGDRGQSYSWSAIAYGDWLYVGTCYAAMGNTLTLMDGVLGDKFDKDVMEAALKAMFNNTFFYGQTKPDGTPDTDSEGILVKVNTKTGEMKLLLSKSMNDVAPMFRNAVAYKDKLYFCGSVHANAEVVCPAFMRLTQQMTAIRLSMWAWILCRIMVLRIKQVFLPVSVVCASITMSWSSAMFI